MEALDYQIKITEKEFAILEDLYNYRVFTTNQIKKKHFNNKGNYVNNVLSKMREKGLIKTSTLSNSREGKKGFSYHRMTETGLERLAKRGKSVEGKSSLYVKPKQVPYLLMTNDLVVDLAETDWEIWDSRRVKSHYNLDDRMNIQGLMISPEKQRYGLYVMDANVSEQTIGKIQSEIRANADMKIHDYLIIARGRISFNEFASRAIVPTKDSRYRNKPLVTGYKIKLYPYRMFLYKALGYSTEKEWMKRLCNYYGITIKSMEKQQGIIRQTFPVIIEYEGEEMYLVDMIDSDLNMLNDIILYTNTNSNYRWENRRILVVLLDLDSKVNELLDEKEKQQKILQIKVSPMDMEELCRASIIDTDCGYLNNH